MLFLILTGLLAGFTNLTNLTNLRAVEQEATISVAFRQAASHQVFVNEQGIFMNILGSPLEMPPLLSTCLRDVDNRQVCTRRPLVGGEVIPKLAPHEAGLTMLLKVVYF